MTNHEKGEVMETVELLRTLSNTFGIPGFENEVRDVLSELVEPYVDEIKTDTLGNLIAMRKGSSSTKLMLDAHMDEIGFMISYIEDDGFLRITTVGGWDVRILPSHKMQVRTNSGEKISGVIGTPPPHILSAKDREKPFPINDLFVDIGANSREEVENLGIRIGSPAAISYPFEQLNEKFVCGKALDDRAGCAVILKTLEALKDEELDVTLYLNFAVCEEVGLRGAQTAAYQIEPDIALALEGTVGADVPEIPKARQPTKLGQGGAISVIDRTIIVNPKLIESLTNLAEENGINYQYKVPAPGGTDAGAIHLSKEGVLAGVLAVPCRYIHSPFSILSLEDFENVVKLTTEFVRNGNKILEHCRY